MGLERLAAEPSPEAYALAAQALGPIGIVLIVLVVLYFFMRKGGGTLQSATQADALKGLEEQRKQIESLSLQNVTDRARLTEAFGRIDSLEDDVEELQDKNRELLLERHEWIAMLQEHAAYDYARRQQILELDTEALIPPAPPLYPHGIIHSN